MILKKLLKLSSINIITSVINFISTIIIIQIFGLNTFGEFAIFTSYMGIFTLLYIIIPPNFSVMKIQDDKSFNNILICSYLLSGLLSIFLLYLIYYIKSDFFGLNLNIYLAIIFLLMYSFFNFIDIQSQANNTLTRYYFYLLFQAICKLIILAIIYYTFNNYDLNLLILSFVIPQIILVLFHFIYFRNEFQNIDIKTKNTLAFLINNFSKLKKYYLETFLKRIKDNILVLIFSNFMPKDIIGLYSLLVKAGTFILSQARILEALLMNRENLKQANQIDNKIYLLAFFIQIIIIIVGIIYLKLSINEYKFWIIIFYSFISYPYLNIITIRNKLYSIYQNKLIIYSLLVYIITILLISLYIYIIKIESIYSIISTVLIAEFISAYYLKYLYKGNQ